MIELTILNADEIANRHSGHVSVSSGYANGHNVLGTVRNQIADHLETSLEEGKIQASVSASGARSLTVEIEDATEAAWEQGYIPWIVTKVVPSAMEYQLTSQLEDQLARQGIQVEAEVV